MKPIYQPKGRAREYGDYAINIYTGCNHGCSYCYARKMKERYTPKGCICTFDMPTVRPGIVEAVQRQLEREKITEKLIHICFTCDPYPADIDTAPTREIIQAIKNSGNHVQILTKGGKRAVRDFDLLDDKDRFGVTITGPAQWVSQNEPKAALCGERLHTLEIAHEQGVYTWVSLEPVFFPDMVYKVIQRGSFIDLFKIGKLNYVPSEIKWAEFGEKAERLCREYKRNYYIKEDLRAEMEGHK